MRSKLGGMHAKIYIRHDRYRRNACWRGGSSRKVALLGLLRAPAAVTARWATAAAPLSIILPASWAAAAAAAFLTRLTGLLLCALPVRTLDFLSEPLGLLPEERDGKVDT
jgi:hypothetical protein